MMPSDNLSMTVMTLMLTDWLISRRHCKDQWQDAAVCVREKINNAIQDMPPVEQITTLLHGTCTGHSHT